ncbi:MAG TPA: 4-alpha-glucanotransferase [Thermodesulfobacteriota bacterium]|nr:4-alpha-glucanotransferase [Thermodesulfobacteriota bacterium]
MNKRASGILLHITSLPSRFGIGDMGPESRRFADFLSETRQSYWQVLPINPTDMTFGNSPYSGPSSYAGNPILISPEIMKDAGYLSAADINMKTFPKPERVDYGLVTVSKTALFHRAFRNAESSLPGDSGFKEFSKENGHWLDDYALYASVKKNLPGTWRDFPADLRDRDEKSLEAWREKAAREIIYHKFLQYIFFRQWDSLKKYANERGVEIIGDIPYYINYDSSEVWSNPEFFKLDKDKNPEYVSGVPPDYFSKTGQLWGNPVYDWEALKETGFEWWIRRIGHNLKLFDSLRLDHFRGFVSYWEVKAGERTALNGRWVGLDAVSFFDTLFSHFDKSRFIAEDLGYITPDVKKIIKKYDLPGMKILLFAFGDDFPYGSYLPKNFSNKNCVVYTGTHDNNTVIGWWEKDAGSAEKERFFKYIEYIGSEMDYSDLSWEFIRLAMSSAADTAIIPVQDVMGLGADAKMNRPSTKSGNWEWRLTPGYYQEDLVAKLKEITESSNRGELSG